MVFLVAISLQHVSIDVLFFVHLFKATTLRSLIVTLGASLFYPIFDEDEWPLYDGPTIVAPESMKRQVSGRPKSTRLHNEMDIREGKTKIKCGLCKQQGHNRRSCKSRNQL